MIHLWHVALPLSQTVQLLKASYFAEADRNSDSRNTDGSVIMVTGDRNTQTVNSESNVGVRTVRN